MCRGALAMAELGFTEEARPTRAVAPVLAVLRRRGLLGRKEATVGKEAYKELARRFHGSKPGFRKRHKRARVEPPPSDALARLHKASKQAYIELNPKSILE